MSYRNRRRATLIAAAVVAAALPLSIAQAGVVVSSSGPSAKTYPVGKKLGDSDSVVLKAGDTVTVLDGKGTRVLKGPGTLSLATKTGSDRSGAYAMLTRQRSAARVRTGAVRASVDENPTRPNLWYVDVRQAGPMCIANPAEVRLWRPVPVGEALFAITPSAGTGAKATFGDGEMLTVWDLSAAPVVDGARYVVAGKDGKPTEITFRVLGEVPVAADDLAAALIDKGCMGQLEVLSTAMAEG